MRPQPWAGGKDRTPQQHAQSEGAFFFAPKGVGLFFCEGGAPVPVDKSGVVSEREEGTLAVSESRVEGRRTRPKGAKPARTNNKKVMQKAKHIYARDNLLCACELAGNKCPKHVIITPMLLDGGFTQMLQNGNICRA